MAVNLKLTDSESRERRLGSVTGYCGTLSELANLGCSGCLKNKKRCFQTVSDCSHTHAIDQLAGLVGTVVVDHAPIGCSGAQIWYSDNKNRHNLSFGEIGENSHIISTNIKESDTVFGATEKLKDAIRLAYRRHNPKEIYVVTSCVASIIGEDVFSVTEEMEEELGIPVGYAAAEGIRSKIWSSGFDAYCHAIAKKRLVPPKNKEDLVNYVGFAPSGRDHIEPIMKRLGFNMNFLTGGSSIEDFRRASSAKASFGQCGSQSSYLCAALEQQFGVKYFQQHLPYGGIGFERFLREFAAYFHKEDIAEAIIQEEKEKYKERLEAVREKLKGKKVFIAMGASFAFEYTRLSQELGMKVVHVDAYHFDPKLDNESDEQIGAITDVKELGLDVPVNICDIQQLEVILNIKDNPADIILSRAHGADCWGIRMRGIPGFEARIGCPMIGYRGLVEFGESVAGKLENTNFERKIAQHYQSPFTEKYENLKPYSFYEEGV